MHEYKKIYKRRRLKLVVGVQNYNTSRILSKTDMDYRLGIQVFFFLVGCGVARLQQIEGKDVTISVTNNIIRDTVDDILYRYGPNVNSNTLNSRYHADVCVMRRARTPSFHHRNSWC